MASAGLQTVIQMPCAQPIASSQNLDVAKRAREAGVNVELETGPEMIHVWRAFAALIPKGREAIERIGAHPKKRLA